MHRRLKCLVLAAVSAVLLATAAAPAGATVFSNNSGITLNNPPNTVADATPYPSTIPVSGLSGTVSHVAVTLSGVNYLYS